MSSERMVSFLKIGASLLCLIQLGTAYYYGDGNGFEGLPYPPPYAHPHHGYRYPFPQPQFTFNNNRKPIQAVIPVSPVFDVEVMRPMAQLEERKAVTLYIVPQNSLNVVPHIYKKNPVDVPASAFGKYQNGLPLITSITTNPGHIPAIEVPLAKPLVITVAELQVLAPAGFTVLFKGPLGSPLTYPVITGALLAPVPVGTIISPETPVVITTIYAVPSLPAFPGSIKILAEVSRRGTSTSPAKARPVYPQFSIRPVPGGPSGYPFNPFQFAGIPAITNGYGHGTLSPFPIGFHELQATNVVSAASPAKQTVPSTSEVEIINFGPTGGPSIAHQIHAEKQQQQLQQFVSVTPAPHGSTTFEPHFVNSKESPVLTQIREESLKRQILELQHELQDLQIQTHSK